MSNKAGAAKASSERVVFVRVTGDLKSQIKADAAKQRRTESEVVRQILRNHYETQESLPQ